MPIYRGDRLVTPRPGGQAVARVYRGDRLVWQAGPAWAGEQATIPAQTIPAQSGALFTGSTITIPDGITGQVRIRATINWTNRDASQLYRIAIFKNGNRSTGYESPPNGAGAYTHVLEMGYGTPPYRNSISASGGDTFAVGAWVVAPSATHRQISQSSFSIEMV